MRNTPVAWRSYRVSWTRRLLLQQTQKQPWRQHVRRWSTSQGR
jgi:hypothetical protein